MKTLDDLRQAFSLLPSVSFEDVGEALRSAGKCLPSERQSELTRRLDNWFADYFRDCLWEMIGGGANSSDAAKRLKGIAGTCRNLCRMLGEEGETMPDLLRVCLAREANFRAEREGPYPGYAPLEFTAPTDSSGATIVSRLDFRGDEKVDEIIEGLRLLTELAESAHQYERRKVEGRKTPRRHEGDRQMPELLRRLIRAWIEFFEEIPGTSYNTHKGEATGPLIRCVGTLLRRAREKMPDELNQLAPKLREALDLTDNAIRDRIRRANPPLPSE